jgi:hypothetical protein
MDEEALEPRIEPVRIAEPSQVPPGDHQRILQGILGPIDVAEDPLGDGKEAVASNADQVDERRPIPALRRLDEIAIHRVCPFGTRWWCPPTLLVGSAGRAFKVHAYNPPISSKSGGW